MSLPTHPDANDNEESNDSQHDALKHIREHEAAIEAALVDRSDEVGTYGRVLLALARGERPAGEDLAALEIDATTVDREIDGGGQADPRRFEAVPKKQRAQLAGRIWAAVGASVPGMGQSPTSEGVNASEGGS